MYLKFIIVTVILSNTICQNQAEEYDMKNTSVLGSALKILLQKNEHMTSLPKNYVLTDEEIYNYTQEYNSGLNNEDIHLSGTQLIQKYGYQVEEHFVITSDGYNLTLIRIPGKGRPVFLMHGLENSFVDWLTTGPDNGLAYLLAAEGYDVWMGNARGNTYSKKNIRLSPSDSKFWDFSWNEIARLDLPAMIDYTLNITGENNLTYIGHSQGTTAFFVLCSVKPEYNKKINFMAALSAVAWMSNVTSPLVRIASHYNPILYTLGKALGFNDVGEDNALKKFLTSTFCGDALLATIICNNVAFLLFGFDYSQINYKQLPVIYSHNPAGSSLKQLIHYAQLVESGDFRNFDYGTVQNLLRYGSSNPPAYAVDKISVPVAIFYSYGDWLANPLDVNILRNKLPNVVDYYQIPLLTFNHVDYLYARDVKSLVYDRLLNLIKENK